MFTKLGCYLFGHDDVAPGHTSVTVELEDGASSLTVPLPKTYAHCRRCGSRGSPASSSVSVHAVWRNDPMPHMFAGSDNLTYVANWRGVPPGTAWMGTGEIRDGDIALIHDAMVENAPWKLPKRLGTTTLLRH